MPLNIVRVRITYNEANIVIMTAAEGASQMRGSKFSFTMWLFPRYKPLDLSRIQGNKKPNWGGKFESAMGHLTNECADYE